MRRALLRANAIAGAALLLLLLAFVITMCAASTPPKKPKIIKHPYYPFTVEMCVYDNPLLVGKDRIIEARETGVAAFWFDGEYYVVEDLPEGYIRYSVKMARMPSGSSAYQGESRP